jgi:outer membrane protein assembly factor BamB
MAHRPVSLGCNALAGFGFAPRSISKMGDQAGRMAALAARLGQGRHDLHWRVRGDAKALFAVNPDGTKRWEYPVPGNVTTAPVVGQFGTIYFSADDDKIRALTPDGKKLWEYYVSTGVKASPSVGPDGTIYLAATQRLYALHPDGTEKWVYWGKSEMNSSPAIGRDGTLYVGTSDGGQFAKKYLYAFNPDGTVKWKHPVPHRIASSPSIGRDGTIYVGCADNKVYAFTPDGEKNGRLTPDGLWTPLWL